MQSAYSHVETHSGKPKRRIESKSLVNLGKDMPADQAKHACTVYS